MRDPDSEAALAAAFKNGRVEEVTQLHRRDDVPAMLKGKRLQVSIAAWPWNQTPWLASKP